MNGNGIDRVRAAALSAVLIVAAEGWVFPAAGGQAGETTGREREDRRRASWSRV